MLALGFREELLKPMRGKLPALCAAMLEPFCIEAKYDLSQPYTVGEGVIVTRADDDSIKTLADIRGKTAAENATSNWSQIAKDAGAKVEAVEGFTQAITLLTQGRVDVVERDLHPRPRPPAGVGGEPRVVDGDAHARRHPHHQPGAHRAWGRRL